MLSYTAAAPAATAAAREVGAVVGGDTDTITLVVLANATLVMFASAAAAVATAVTVAEVPGPLVDESKIPLYTSATRPGTGAGRAVPVVPTAPGACCVCDWALCRWSGPFCP